MIYLYTDLPKKLIKREGGALSSYSLRLWVSLVLLDLRVSVLAFPLQEKLRVIGIFAVQQIDYKPPISLFLQSPFPFGSKEFQI